MVVLSALAGGMGWGIRGQYGHETGAMIAGVLIGFVLVLFLAPGLSSLQGARAVAMLAVGVAFGGSMTYGQTVGLTHNPAMVGNWPALRWGLVGLCVKGGIWFGFAGAFLGMGLGGKRYRPVETVLILLAILGLTDLGVQLLNRPFDPANRVLPAIYFSADWYWQPDVADLKPRPEVWGGLLVALLGLTLYTGLARRDRLARNLAVIGFIGGALGFPTGQCIQAFHAWNKEMIHTGSFAEYAPFINWWNMMEITFGTIAGGVLAAGLWTNRRLIAPMAEPDEVVIGPGWEFLMLAAHLPLLIGAEFFPIGPLPMFLEYGATLALIALPAIVGGRYWPYLFPLTVVAVPIAGKTLRELCYKTSELDPQTGWIVLVALPMAVTLLAAIWLARRGLRGQSAGGFAAVGLVLTTLLYFGLNFGFFRMPLPWQEWTGRTPSGLIFAFCSVMLLLAALIRGSRTGRA